MVQTELFLSFRNQYPYDWLSLISIVFIIFSKSHHIYSQINFHGSSCFGEWNARNSKSFKKNASEKYFCKFVSMQWHQLGRLIPHPRNFYFREFVSVFQTHMRNTGDLKARCQLLVKWSLCIFWTDKSAVWMSSGSSTNHRWWDH